MDVSESGSPTAVERGLGISAVIAALKAHETDSGGNESQMERDNHGAAPGIEVTSDNVSMHLRGLSGNSYHEIEALVGELRRLREKLVTDTSRIEQRIVEFARLNQSIMKLTKLVSDRVGHVQVPSDDFPAAG
jgi:hypothetical protein